MEQEPLKQGWETELLIKCCLSCSFYQPRDDGKSGSCHRFPPQRGMGLYEQGESLTAMPDCDFALTQPHYWCGEYQELTDMHTVEWENTVILDATMHYPDDAHISALARKCSASGLYPQKFAFDGLTLTEPKKSVIKILLGYKKARMDIEEWFHLNKPKGDEHGNEGTLDR